MKWLVPLLVGVVMGFVLKVSGVFSADGVSVPMVLFALALAFLAGSSTAARLVRRW